MGPSSHYFARSPQAARRPHEFEVKVRGEIFRFMTDSGVFSRGRLDPGTRLLLSQIALPERGLLLDWGAGYGPIGICLARLCPQAQVVLAEVNERAVDLCHENLRLNRVTNAEVLAGDAHEVLGSQTFDLIATNPPIRAGKKAVLALFEDAASRLNRGGSFWFVARTRQGAKTLARSAADYFEEVELQDIHSGYRLYRAWGQSRGGP